MTRSVQIVERMRWMSALAGAAVLAIAVAIALGATGGQLRTLVPGSSSGSAPAAGSSAPLDPRIATLAAHQPGVDAAGDRPVQCAGHAGEGTVRRRPASTGA